MHLFPTCFSFYAKHSFAGTFVSKQKVGTFDSQAMHAFFVCWESVAASQCKALRACRVWLAGMSVIVQHYLIAENAVSWCGLCMLKI